jgi:hypothetical protein
MNIGKDVASLLYLVLSLVEAFRKRKRNFLPVDVVNFR